MICPRCQSPDASTVARSPVPGVWTMTSCPTCWYAWRSTEPPAATDPDLYYSEFRLDRDEIPAAPLIV
jgi:vanillate/4-hydroxybenzoate decarboxylase subunit D